MLINCLLRNNTLYSPASKSHVDGRPIEATVKGYIIHRTSTGTIRLVSSAFSAMPIPAYAPATGLT